jgi:putative SOS response-associated peptidase YedK
MCGRYTLTSQEGLLEDLEAALGGGAGQRAFDLAPGLTANPAWKPRFNIAPTQLAPIVAMHVGDGWSAEAGAASRVLELMRWGVVPFWAGKARGKRPPLMINARSETVADKAPFRDAMVTRRCLVPADGFFEWKHAGKVATPMWIRPWPRRVIAFAAVWQHATTETAGLPSFAILTGPPNALVSPIHDRMPIVLDRSVWAAWLDASLDRDGARALLAVPPVDDWRAEPVSSWVNKADHDDPRCVEPAGPPTQTSLFD